MQPGVYRIKTTHHGPGQQEAGWGLSAWHKWDDQRNGSSSWVRVHRDADRWACDWEVEAGKKPGTWRIKTLGHAEGDQQAGWGLSAWHAHGAVRNGGSSWAAVHDGDHWPMDWTIEPGKKPDTWRILTTHHEAGKQDARWGLSAWHGHGAVRNEHSSKVAVHEGDHWPMDWTFERQGFGDGVGDGGGGGGGGGGAEEPPLILPPGMVQCPACSIIIEKMGGECLLPDARYLMFVVRCVSIYP